MDSTERRRIVRDAETLKALADPARLAMLDFAMSDFGRSWTARELADVAGMTNKQVYYHLNLLEQHGLLEVRSTRVVNGIIEKHYGAGQQVISFQQGDGQESGLAGEQGAEMVSSLFGNVLANIHTGLAAGTLIPDRTAPDERRAVVSHTIASMDPRRAAEFREALLKLVEEFREENAADAPRFELLVAIHPLTAP